MRSPVLLLLTISLLTTTAFSAGDADLFPSVDGWKLTPGEKVYTPENLWDLIDGAAELYLSYGFVHLTLGEYANPARVDVRVELYRHSSPVNAFGIYSQERNPEYHFVDIGVQGYIEDGVLNFLCGPFYVKMTTHRSGKAGQEALTLIGRTLAVALHQDAGWPSALALLPAAGRRTNTETYIAENFLGYSSLRSAYVADYAEPGGMQAFIIESIDREKAQRMLGEFLKEVHQEGKSLTEGMLRVEDPNNGTLYLLLFGRYLGGIVHSPSEATAETLLHEMEKHLK